MVERGLREYTWRDFGTRACGLAGAVVSRVLVSLPLICGGRGARELLYLALGERRHITLTNLRACFPIPAARTGGWRARFRATRRRWPRRSVVGSEARMSAWRTPGREQTGCWAKPDLLVAHFVAIEVAGMVLAPDYFMIDCTASPNRFFDWLIRTAARATSRRAGLLVERREGIKPVIRGIRRGGRSSSPTRTRGAGAVFVPFFGVPRRSRR